MRGEDAISTSGLLLSQPADSPAKGTPFPVVSVTWVASDLSWLGLPQPLSLNKACSPLICANPLLESFKIGGEVPPQEAEVMVLEKWGDVC